MQIFPLEYKNEGKKIGVSFGFDNAIKAQLKLCGDLKYSKTYKTWYLPYAKDFFKNLKT